MAMQWLGKLKGSSDGFDLEAFEKGLSIAGKFTEAKERRKLHERKMAATEKALGEMNAEESRKAQMHQMKMQQIALSNRQDDLKFQDAFISSETPASSGVPSLDVAKARQQALARTKEDFEVKGLEATQYGKKISNLNGILKVADTITAKQRTALLPLFKGLPGYGVLESFNTGAKDLEEQHTKKDAEFAEAMDKYPQHYEALSELHQRLKGLRYKKSEGSEAELAMPPEGGVAGAALGAAKKQVRTLQDIVGAAKKQTRRKVSAAPVGISRDAERRALENGFKRKHGVVFDPMKPEHVKRMKALMGRRK